MHALDHVGAVEDERLVALALQAAVVLGRQVELLERRAHAAVVDDDAVFDRIYVVAGHSAMLARATLDRRSQVERGKDAGSVACLARERLRTQPGEAPAA